MSPIRSELGRYYSDQGADELVFYDITASYEDRDIFIHIVEKVAEAIHIPFTIGGGIWQQVEDFRKVLMAGADKVSVNSSAVKNPQLIRRKRPFVLVPSVWFYRLMPSATIRVPGMSTLKAAGKTPGSMPLNGPNRVRTWVPEKSVSTPSIPMGLKRAMIWSSTRNFPVF